MTLPSSGSARERTSFVGRNAWTPYVLITLTVVFFAGGYIVGRAAHEIFPAAGLTFWRNVLAVLVLWPFVCRHVHQQAPLALRHWKLMLMLGVTNAVTGQGLLYLALHTTTAINIGLINAMQPAFIMVIAWLLLRDPISPRQGVGIVIGFAGVAVIISRGTVEQLIALDFAIGDVWFQVAMMSFALYAVLVKCVPPGFSALGLLAGHQRGQPRCVGSGVRGRAAVHRPARGIQPGHGVNGAVHRNCRVDPRHHLFEHQH